ncbi:unnamed protein product [Effrenium voratum]|uniref:Uncharacterized protein n=1 Tax=Effrenium voratum TaxID=2562239 RepID=A0AA36N8N9_9DINO|nr:unnamed protein product [Effrenium voratum]
MVTRGRWSQVYVDAMGKGTKDYARVCSDLATAYFDLDKRERAAELYAESQSAFEATGEEDVECAGEGSG